MRTAQQSYEGAEVEGRGTIVLIIHLRIDSTRVAGEVDAAAWARTRESYRETYVVAEWKEKWGGQKIQDAHEATRPIDITLTSAVVKTSLSRGQFRLHQLTWKCFAAGRTQEAVCASTSTRLVCGEHRLSLFGPSLRFSGLMEVYSNSGEGEEGKPDAALSRLGGGEELIPGGFDKERHFTQPPAHYTRASLVHAVGEQGIGRPNAYASTTTTTSVRCYVIKEQENLYVTESGQVVNRMMVRSLPVIVEPQFTTNLERLPDSVGEDRMNWRTVVESFYPDLSVIVKQMEEKLKSVEIADEESDVGCKLCGRYIAIKYEPHGKFLACSDSPECRNMKSYLEKIGVKCPKCGSELVRKRMKKRRTHYGYEDNPTCEFVSWVKPSEKCCPKCGGYMTERSNKLACTNEACGYSEVFGKEDKG